MTTAILDGAAVHFAIERVAGAGVLIGVGEHAEIVESGGGDELAQLLEVRGGFTREAHDEAGAYGDARNGAADALDQLEKNLARPSALHALENAAARVLQRHVDVPGEGGVSGDGVEQALRDFVRIGVEEADPLLGRGLNLR